MPKAKLIKYLKQAGRKELLTMLLDCDQLGIDYAVQYQQTDQKTDKINYWLKLTRDKKYFYTYNSNLGCNFNNTAATIVEDKQLTKEILAKNAISVPRGLLANSLEEIRQQLKQKKIDYPLVIKPLTLSLGKGVYADIQDWSAVKTAYNLLRSVDPRAKDNPIIVEEFFGGRDFRILVLGGRFLACCERVHPHIIGDGKKSIKTLLRQPTAQFNSKKFKLDWEFDRCLNQQKLTLSSIPKPQQKIFLRRNANIATGAISINRTQELCPAFKKIAINCAKIFNMQIAGIDLMTSDPSNPKADYRIIEINSLPDFFIHDDYTIGQSDQITRRLLKELFNLK